MHSVDASMALLAIALADAANPSRVTLRKYGEAHTKRIMTPLIVMTGMGARGSWNLQEVIPAIHAIVHLRRYVRSREITGDSRETRIERIGQGFDQIFRAFRSSSLPEGVVDIFRDYLITKILNDIEDQTDGV